MSTTTPNGISPMIALFVLGVLIVFYIAWHFTRSRSLLQKWATSNGYEILHSEFRSLRKGPFLWKDSAKQMVFYVRIRSREGQERSGWVLCGGFWTGLFSDKIQVTWEDES